MWRSAGLGLSLQLVGILVGIDVLHVAHFECTSMGFCIPVLPFRDSCTYALGDGGYFPQD